jgi:hypothetical protein
VVEAVVELDVFTKLEMPETLEGDRAELAEMVEMVELDGRVELGGLGGIGIGICGGVGPIAG